jgi:hypothetical protein
MADDRYLLLHADVGMGEGRVLPQPWVQECYGLLYYDMCGDWQDGLTKLGEDIGVRPRGTAEIVPFPSGKGTDIPDET